MNSLNSSPVAEVLERLHQEAEAADAPLMQTYVRDPRNGYLSLPLPFDPGRGNEFTIKTK
jgi:hypothetical protein